MALNPKTIKAMFGKLSPKPSALPSGFPTLASGALETGRDMRRIINNVNPDALPVKNAGNVLKKALDINPTLEPRGYIETNPLVRASNQKFWTFHNRALPAKAWTDVPETVSKLGDDVLEEGLTRMWNNPTSTGISLPAPLPTKELVVSGESVLPHRNTALGRYYSSRMFNIDNVHKNPPLKKLPTFASEQDYEDMLSYLDDIDAVKRVNLNVGAGTLGDVSSQDLLRYPNTIPNLKYYDDYDENDLTIVYDELKRRQNTANQLRDLFGHTPRSFASNDEYENALATLFDELSKLPF